MTAWPDLTLMRTSSRTTLMVEVCGSIYMELRIGTVMGRGYGKEEEDFGGGGNPHSSPGQKKKKKGFLGRGDSKAEP